ncbi:D-2-hydroxyacid dehydrogenase [Bifidobacterium xylocopae]|uniref:Hydroxyacid dehydrogenase n=1 Tax=Bifidobacterium xylocopae TaxID=2493119 RepID=A0A366KBA2_9BIFI|nr:D-2-hydroxyacid dehydrogenase [Bifidobacterium xylocopae]RBP99000.1 hydroxyacid dehydrogenase [Bifidobacterium xylocopae]
MDTQQVRGASAVPARHPAPPRPDRVHIINGLPLTAIERKRFERAADGVDQRFITDPSTRDNDVWGVELPMGMRDEATVIIGNPPPEQVADCRHLAWLQTASAGVNAYESDGVLPAGAMLSGASGALGQSVSEHMFAMMWSLMKRLPRYRDLQGRSRWEGLGRSLSPVGAKVLLLGTGDLGSHFARLVKSVGARTIGVRRDSHKPAVGVDEMHGFGELDHLLPDADVVAMTLPAAANTHHLMDAHHLALLKSTAILINAGRGDAVDCQALATCLEQGRIWGAGLDVTEPEPLPPGHPLWKQERCQITPHVAGGTNLAVNADRIVAIALENLQRYMEGRPLRNRVR